jgi:purine-nucleoside phosphorylase
VLGISGISNVIAPEEGGPGASHQEVLQAGRILAPRLEAIIRGVLRQL